MVTPSWFKKKGIIQEPIYQGDQQTLASGENKGGKKDKEKQPNNPDQSS